MMNEPFERRGTMDALFRNRFNRYNLIAVGLLLVLGFFWIYPFLWVLFASFKSSSEMFSAGATLLPETWD